MHLVAEVRLDAKAVARNAELIRKRIRPARLMAVVKMDGYGHGAVSVAAAARPDWVAVGSAEEARRLRKAGIDVPGICLLPESPAACRRWNVLPTMFDEPLEGPLALKINTGMFRMGCRWDRLPDVRDVRLAYSTLVEVPRFHPVQAERLQAAREKWPDALISLASTAALEDPSLHFDMVRVGIGLLGFGQPWLTPAIVMTAPVVAVHDVRAGEGVGYGHLYRYPRDGKVAVLLAGWANGVPRALSNRGEVILHGRRARIVGLVSMSHMLVDATDLPVRKGDEAVLLGEGLSPERWAQWAGTSIYEVVVRLRSR